MMEYHGKTCIRFVPRTNQQDYIIFKKTGSGWDNIDQLDTLSQQGIQPNSDLKLLTYIDAIGVIATSGEQEELR